MLGGLEPTIPGPSGQEGHSDKGKAGQAGSGM